MVTLWQEMKTLLSELKEQLVIAVGVSSRPVDPNQLTNQKTVLFCNYCRTNGHTQKWCRKKMCDEEVWQAQAEMSVQRQINPMHIQKKCFRPKTAKQSTEKPISKPELRK